MIQAELISHMGSDLTVVNSARVSFNKESGLDENGYMASSDAKLISYLARHGHFTPFTHPQITLRETVPIFVARQRFKHVVGFTYNEVSRRYVNDSPEFYMPEVWRSRPEGSVKQGSAGEHPENAKIKGLYTHTVQIALDTYESLIQMGVAPEQARMVLPQSMLTSYYVTGSLAAYARAYNQRSDPHAQKESQDLAFRWNEILTSLYPVSWAALTRWEY